MSPISFSRTFLAQFDLVQCLFSPIRCDGTKISFRKLTIWPAFMFLIRDITPSKWICLLTGPPWWQRSHELVLSRIGFEEGTLVRLGSLARGTWWDIFKKKELLKRNSDINISICAVKTKFYYVENVGLTLSIRGWLLLNVLKRGHLWTVWTSDS